MSRTSSWIEGLVCLPDKNAKETEAVFADLLVDVDAEEKIGAGPCPHVTLLYHGHPISPALEDVVQRFNVEKAEFTTVITGVRCVSDTNYWAIVLVLESAALVEYCIHLIVAIEVETKQYPVSNPHFYCNDSHRPVPRYVTLAKFESVTQMDKEAPAILASFAKFIGVNVFLSHFKLMTDE